MKSSSSSIIVEQGTPFEKGAFIPINLKKTIIGRKSKDWAPDISFRNIHVSREHLAILSNESGEFFVKDLGSKHGTWLNQRRLTANQMIPLNSSDTISLAGGLIKFSFILSSLELTADFAPMFPPLTTEEFILDTVKQELRVQGDTCVFSEKEFKCIELLINNREQFVSIDKIKETVWQERKHSVDEIPDVTSEEVNALIYRLRKKLHENICVENIRGRGYILSFV
ncbi:FHA domain-containing protein [Bacillus salacetis]|uniref:FHA domain-containing protein n=1 Tax=Bacillus salacetis TaxID=2315464 RepID=UPI003BA17650